MFFASQSSDYEPRDPTEIIDNWYQFAAIRRQVQQDEDEYGNPIHFDNQAVAACFAWYLDDFKRNDLSPEQRRRSLAQQRSAAEAKMFRLCGSRFAAFAVWELGVPTVSKELLAILHSGRAILYFELHAVVERTATLILRWLQLVAESIVLHKQTPHYKDVRARVGNTKNQSGLTASQHAERDALRAAKASVRRAEKLNSEWSQRKRYWHQFRHEEQELLHEFWNGKLQERVSSMQVPHGYGNGSVSQDAVSDTGARASGWRDERTYRVMLHQQSMCQLSTEQTSARQCHD